MRALALLAVAACGYHPGYGSGDLACGPGGACPGDLACRSDDRCYAPEDPGPLAELPDAGLDAEAPPDTVQLSVAIEAPTGSGAITASTGAIDCGGVCAADYARGSEVTLTATPTSGSVFVGWKGAAKGCQRQPTCTLTLDAAARVQARFAFPGQPAWLHPLLAGAVSLELRLGDDGALAFALLMPSRLELLGLEVESDGASDILFGKIGAGGELLWSRHVGSATDDRFDCGLALDRGSGDLVLGSVFTATELDLGGATTLANSGPAGTGDLWLARFDGATGALRWQRRIPTDDLEDPILTGVAFDERGNVVFAGSAMQSIDLGDGPLTVPGGEGDIFLAEYVGASGELAWKRQLGGTTAYGYANDLVVDSKGDVIIAGYFGGRALDLGGPSKPDSVSGSSDGFVAAYEGTSGGFRWQQTFGTAGLDYATAVAVGPDDAPYLAAHMEAGGDPIAFLGATLPGAGTGLEIVVAKLAAATGGLAWARRYGTAALDEVADIAVFGGGVALIGQYATPLTFDSLAPLPAPQGTDLYLAILSDATGAASYAVAMGGSGTEWGTKLTASGRNLILGGRFGVTASFLGLPLTAVHAQDLFILSLFR